MLYYDVLDDIADGSGIPNEVCLDAISKTS